MSEIKEATQIRNTRIIEEFYGDEDTPGKSFATLTKEFGLDRSTIQRLVKVEEARADFDRVRHLKPHDPRVLKTKKPLTSIHYRIGMRLGRHMSEHSLSPSMMALQINKSRNKVVDIQCGSYDLTLMDVHELSEALDIPYEELVLGKAKEATCQ
jgi:hypothetical protein